MAAEVRRAGSEWWKERSRAEGNCVADGTREHNLGVQLSGSANIIRTGGRSSGHSMMGLGTWTTIKTPRDYVKLSRVP